MALRFKPRLEGLEAREVPAVNVNVNVNVNWTWDPGINSNAGNNPANWTNDGGLVNQIPDDATDNVIFVGNTANKVCNFGAGQGTLGEISADNAYTNTITLVAGGAATFTKASILGACTIDLNTRATNFGGTVADPSAIGVAGGARATVKGGGSVEVTNNGRINLANVNLASSVNVNAGGKLTFGFVNYGTDTASTFVVNGGIVESGSNAQFISSTSVVQGETVYNQPLTVVDGQLNIVTDTTVASYIWCLSSGTVTVKGTQASPNVTLIVTGGGVIEDTLWGVYVEGVLNLSPGSNIQSNVIV